MRESDSQCMISEYLLGPAFRKSVTTEHPANWKWLSDQAISLQGAPVTLDRSVKTAQTLATWEQQGASTFRDQVPQLFKGLRAVQRYSNTSTTPPLDWTATKVEIRQDAVRRGYYASQPITYPSFNGSTIPVALVGLSLVSDIPIEYSFHVVLELCAALFCKQPDPRAPEENPSTVVQEVVERITHGPTILQRCRAILAAGASKFGDLTVIKDSQHGHDFCFQHEPRSHLAKLAPADTLQLGWALYYLTRDPGVLQAIREYVKPTGA